MKVAVIGVGEIALLHLNALKETNQEIVALCDIETSKCEKANEKFSLSAKIYEDYKKMLDNEDLDVNSYLNIVRSDVNYRYVGSTLECISVTYTVSYKDKINAVEKDRIYRFNFSAQSNPNVKQAIGFVILGQDKISQVYGTVYSNLADFPQTPEKNNII